MYKNRYLLQGIFISLLLLAGCGGGKFETGRFDTLPFPPTKAYLPYNQWAVVVWNYERILEDIVPYAEVNGIVRRGDIVRIEQDNVRGGNSILLYVRTDTLLTGWLDRDAVERYQTREQAEHARHTF